MIKKLALIFAIGLFAVGSAVVFLLGFYPHFPGAGTGQLREITVEQGIGPKALARTLHRAEFIDNESLFTLWLRLSDSFSSVKAGRFQMRDNLSPSKIIRELSSKGLDRGTKVTIPEGFNLRQIGEALESAKISSSVEFLKAANHLPLLKTLGIPGDRAEGYLFPDTYFFSAPSTPEDILKKMYENFLERIESIEIKEASRLAPLVTLASIVQAEARLVEEMPVIAGVYANRLKGDGFPSRLLQADPTVSYGCESFIRHRAPSCKNFNGTITRSMLDDDGNRFNTYRHPGLPPGPICSPGLSAIRAAAHPARVPYFYFVVESGGKHAFSSTLEEHVQAVHRYRRTLLDHGEKK